MSNFSDLVASMDAVQLSAFSTSVRYLSQGGDDFVVSGILDHPNRLEAEFPKTHVSLFIRSADLPMAPLAGDIFIIEPDAWEVFDINKDAEGGIVLMAQLTDHP